MRAAVQCSVLPRVLPATCRRWAVADRFRDSGLLSLLVQGMKVSAATRNKSLICFPDPTRYTCMQATFCQLGENQYFLFLHWDRIRVVA